MSTARDECPVRPEAHGLPGRRRKLDWRRVVGPGLITGASDDDPSGIATYSQAGAQFGFALSWTMILTFPLMSAVQMISARIGRVTGHGIAGNLVRHYPAWLANMLVLLLLANKRRLERVRRRTLTLKMTVCCTSGIAP